MQRKLRFTQFVMLRNRLLTIRTSGQLFSMGLCMLFLIIGLQVLPNGGRGSAFGVQHVNARFLLPPSTDVGDVAVNIGGTSIMKLSAADGTVLWSTAVVNDGAIAVDPADFGVYTARGNHSFVGSGNVYRYDNTGTLVWANSITRTGPCDFNTVNGVAVDAASPSPGIIYTETGCFGGIAKTDRTNGNQQWSDFTNDIGRPTIDPANGDIFDITNAGPPFNYNTIYRAAADGTLTSASSCERLTDLNPVDGTLYRGGNMTANGCGLTLSQIDKTTLTANWNFDLSPFISSFDSLAIEPWTGGYILVGSVSDSKIVEINPQTQTVVRTFSTAVAPAMIAVNPTGGNIYIANGTSNFVYAYSVFGGLVWTSPDLGGIVASLATPRNVAGTIPPTAAPISLSGRVLTSYGRYIGGASVSLTDGSGMVRDTRSTSLGYFHFENLSPNRVYILNASAKRYEFVPKVVKMSDDLADFDLLAQP